MGNDIGSVTASGTALRLARAYGVVTPQPPRVSTTGVTPPGGATFQGFLPGDDVAGVAGSVGARARGVVDSVSLASASIDPARVAELRAEVGRTLSAAKLEVGIEPGTGMPVARSGASRVDGATSAFTGLPAAAASAGSQAVLPRTPAAVLAMYRRPADQNVAATGVALGRQVDLQG